MTLQVTDTDLTDRAISAIEVTDVGSVNRVISEIRVIDSNGVDRVVFSTAIPFSVSISPSLVSGYSSGSGTVTTDAATATPVGGVAPYTYAWSIDVFDGPGPPTANSPTSATTTFTQTGLAPGGSALANWICDVTDSTLATTSAECSASFLDI